MKVRKWTKEEDENILRLKEQGFSYRQISEVLKFRTERAIEQRYYNIRHTNDAPDREVLQPAQRRVTLEDFTPREIIKHLYDLGYRIEDGRLVLVQRTVVKLGDILNG